MAEQADSGDRRPKQIIYDHEMAALSAVREYRRFKLRPDPVPDHVVRELAERALGYREVLHKYREEDALDPPWEERQVHWIEQEQNESVTVEVPSARRNGNTRTVQKPAILAVDPEKLVDVVRRLEDIADELGFTATTTESTHRTEIDDDLMEEVEKWRKENLEG